MADKDLTPEQLLYHARQSFSVGHTSETAAYASLAAVGLLEQFLALARDGIAHEWSNIQRADGGEFACVCGSRSFTEYPNTDAAPYVTCSTSNCPTVWDLGVDGIALPVPRRVLPLDSPEPSWQRNDLVRYRDRDFTPGVSAEYVVLLQAEDEGNRGWWNGMVMRTSPGAGVIVGQPVVLREGASQCRVARFPD